MNWLWQIPQHIIAIVLIRIVGAKRESKYFAAFVYTTHWRMGISLGEYIIVWDDAPADTIRHEFGHTEQSRMLGPLYLIVVGLPSLARNLIWRAFSLDTIDYYHGYPERWADRLGGVQRDY